MSGGAWNYASYKVTDLACRVEDEEIAELLKDLGELIHDEEWYESGDYSRADYLETLDKFKKKWFKSSREERLVGIINEELDHFKNRLNELV
jgi:hypothetical protein